jgi:hypothetical protein
LRTHTHTRKTWSLILREEQRLRVFDNRVLSRIFGQKRDEVTGQCRKLHNEKLHILYLSPSIISQIKSRRMRQGTWHAWDVYRVLMGNPEGKRPLGRPRCGWKDGIRMDLREIGWGSVEWIQLAQDRNQWWALVNTVMILQVLVPRS